MIALSVLAVSGWMVARGKEPKRLYNSAIGKYAWFSGSTCEWELPSQLAHWMRTYFPTRDAAIDALALALAECREACEIPQ